MSAETTEELLRRRSAEIRRGVITAIAREVAWLRRHNFPVWVYENGRVVDAAKRCAAEDPRPPE
jgi:hypothetical protein